MGISTNPDTFSEGMFDDMQVEVKASRWALHNFAKAGDPENMQPSFIMEVQSLENNPEGKSFVQAWKAGDAKDFAPSKDGEELLPVGKKSTLSAACNFALLCRSMKEAGVPDEIVNNLGSKASAMTGSVLHLTKQPINRTIRGEKIVSQVLLVESVATLPGEEAAESDKGKAKGKGKKADRDIPAETTAILMTILEEQGGSISKKKIPAQVIAKTQDADVMALAFDDKFLAAGKDWTFKDGTLTQK